MKKILFSLGLSILTVFVFASNNHIISVNVDSQNSQIKWIGSKISENHEGTINIQKGSLNIDHGTLVGGQISIDMNTINTTDMSEKYNQRLNRHLKNEDFFNVEAHPLSVITITKAIKGQENNYHITADLTIKDITHSISFMANVEIKGSNYSATANIKIDRTKWDIIYKSGNFFKDLGDKIILDEIELDVSLLSVE